MPDAPRPRPVVLVVDDEPGLREVLDITLRRRNYEVVCVAGARQAVQTIQRRETPFQLVLTDSIMPDGSGLDVLVAARERSIQTQVIVITAFSTVETAIDAMRNGAYDYVTKPFSPAEIAELASKAIEKSAILAENERLRERLASIGPTSLRELLGDAPAMRKVATLVEKAATTRTTVLVTGESGTGKERIARLLHDLGDRAAGQFCVVNCGALPETLMESELFGHEKGAFTGAATAAVGLFRQAHGGTLLLDEIGELPASLQVKLLRVLQERKVRPVGSAREVDVDVRVLAATNRDVEADVEAGTFRRDLYYRLNVIRIKMPPLRDRRGDIAKFAIKMVKRFAAEFGKEVVGLTPEALTALEAYDYPGNIRELENVIERAVALTSGKQLAIEDLPSEVSRRITQPTMPAFDLPEAGVLLDDVLAAAERQFLQRALQKSGGVRKSAAKLLGISFRSLRYRLGKLGMDEGDDDSDNSEDDTGPGSSPGSETK